MFKGGKRTQGLSILTVIGGVVNIAQKLIRGEPITIEDIGIVVAGVGGFTAAQKIDRVKNGG